MNIDFQQNFECDAIYYIYRSNKISKHASIGTLGKPKGRDSAMRLTGSHTCDYYYSAIIISLHSNM